MIEISSMSDFGLDKLENELFGKFKYHRANPGKTKEVERILDQIVAERKRRKNEHLITSTTEHK